MPTAPPPAAPAGFDTLMFDASPDCLLVLDLEGQVLALNAKVCGEFELTDPAPLVGRPWPELCHEGDRAMTLAAVREAARGQPQRLLLRHPVAPGERWLDVSVRRGGRPARLLVVARDITEQQVARRALAHGAPRLRMVLDHMQVGEWELRDGRISGSAMFRQCFGLSGAQAGWSLHELLAQVHPDDQPQVEVLLAGRLGAVPPLLAFRLGEDGPAMRWLELRVVGDFTEGGRPLRAGAVRDITPDRLREAAHEELALRAATAAGEADEARQRLQALLDASPVAIAYIHAGGWVAQGNAAHREVFGYSGDHLDLGDDNLLWPSWADGSARDGQALAREELAFVRALRGETVRGEQVRIAPAEPGRPMRTLQVYAAPVRDHMDRISGCVSVHVDVSAQVEALARLRASEARFRTLVDSLPQVVWEMSPQGEPLYVNRRWYEFTGSQDLRRDWPRMIHPEDLAVSQRDRREALAAGRACEVQLRIRHHSGEYRWILDRSQPVTDADGRVISWLGASTDIHEQKQLQLRLEETQRSLELADRRKDQFLAMLAHELRNPLAPIAAAGQALERLEPSPGAARLGQVIGRQIRHITRLVDDLLEVSRVTRGVVRLVPEVLDLRAVAMEAVEQSRAAVERGRHRLDVRLGEAPLWVHGDRTRLVQVVVNLLVNAAKYTPPDGHIVLEAAPQGSEARLVVRDNGRGIAPEFIGQVFELFSQAERNVGDAGGGLGVGLTLARGLVRAHRGSIEARSEGLGCGSEFVVSLPLETGAAAPPAPTEAVRPPAQAPVAAQAGLRIVLVDDNRDGAQALADLLELDGHAVKVFHDGNSLLAAGSDAQADVYVLDIGLPGMDGFELARRLRQGVAAPSARLLALSGYSQAEQRQMARAAGFDAYFVKPVDPAALVAAFTAGPGGG